jgi:hypothetical protein
VIDASHEGRRAGGAGFADAVTFAWADPGSALYGFARTGMADGAGSALAVVFSGREPVGALARGGVAVPPGADWDALALGGVESSVAAALERWTVSFALDGARVELEFSATAAPAEIEAGDAVARVGGMCGYEQPCRVRGRAELGGRTVDVAGAGQRGHQWGEPDWERIALARTVTAWPAEGGGIALSAVRPAKASSHDGEAVWAALLEAGGPVRVEDPRLSTTYDGDGRQRRAGLELWVAEDDPLPQRAAGEVLCGSSLDLGQLRLDCAFFAWRLDGREAVGRYDILRRA